MRAAPPAAPPVIDVDGVEFVMLSRGSDGTPAAAADEARPAAAGNRLLREETLWNVMTEGTVQHDSETVYKAEAELRQYAEVSFKPGVFVKELIAHTFNSVPLVLLFDGWYGAINRRYIPRLWEPFLSTFYGQWINFLCFVAINVLYFLYRPPHIDVWEVVLLDVLWVARNTVVATKYAYTSRRELDDMHRSVLPDEVHVKRQVLTGWLQFSDALGVRELVYASLRQGVDLRALPIKLNMHKHDFRVLFDLALADRERRPGEAYLEPIVMDGDTVRQIPASLLAKQLVFSSKKYVRMPYIGHFVRFLGVLQGFLPAIVRAIQGLPPMGGTEWPAYVIFVLQVYLIFFLDFSNFMFLIAGIVDFRRRRYIHMQLLRLFQDGYIPPKLVLDNQKAELKRRRELFLNSRSRLKTTSSNGSGGSSGSGSKVSLQQTMSGSEMPATVIDMTAVPLEGSESDVLQSAHLRVAPASDDNLLKRSPSTVSQAKSTTSFTTRQMDDLDGSITQGLTLDFTVPENVLAWSRLRDTLSDFGIIYSRRIIIYIGLFLLVMIGFMIFVIVQAILGLPNSIYVIMTVVLYLIVIFTVFFVVIVSVGGDSNYHRQSQAVELLKRKAMLEYIISSSAHRLPEATVNSFRLAIGLVSCVEQLVRSDNELNVTRILGFNAGGQLGRALVVLIVGALGIALRAYF